MKPIRVVHVAPLELPRPLTTYVRALPPGGFLLGGAPLPADDPRAAWDLLGFAPVATFHAHRAGPDDVKGVRRARVRITGAVGHASDDVDFADALRRFVDDARRGFPGFVGDVPLPGGLVGYLGYECGQMLEALPASRRPSLGLPDAVLHAHDGAIAVRRADGAAFFAVVGRGDDDAEAERDVDAKVAGAHAFLTAAPVRCARRSPVEARTAREAIDAEGYRARVGTARALIDAGEAFEICLTNRVAVPLAADPAALFEALVAESPAPYAAYLSLDEGAVVSSSPERFVRVGRDGTMESRPIKGTRPRGRDAAEDQALREDLARAEKDVAENTMIVDLVRNDLGKVCSFGSVVVPELCAVETYATVHQLVSTVRGSLAPSRGAVDAVLACFPPGSMTGAPKVEAMVRIDELEPVERGPYAGALGYFAFDGTADFSVVIRTAVVKDGTAWLGTGGAVTTDSDPDAEHDETQVKLRGVLRAVERAERA